MAVADGHPGGGLPQLPVHENCALDPEGKVFVHGELWKAAAGVPIGDGRKVRITSVDGLTLTVEPEDSAEA